MARLTIVLALACAGLASAEPDVCSLTGSDDECDAGLHDAGAKGYGATDSSVDALLA